MGRLEDKEAVRCMVCWIFSNIVADSATISKKMVNSNVTPKLL